MAMKTLIMMTYCFLCIAQLGKPNMRIMKMMLAEQYKTQPLVSDWIDGSGQREADLFQLGRISKKNMIFLGIFPKMGRGLLHLIDRVREVCNIVFYNSGSSPNN